MKFFKNNWTMILVTALFWCILNESLSLSTIIIGLFVSIITAIAVRLLFSDDQQTSKRDILRFDQLIRHYLVLFFHIFKSAKEVLKIILYEEDNPMIVTIKTQAPAGWARILIANGITLTPGTVTIDLKEDEITVLWLNPSTDDPIEAAKIIQGHFEKVFMMKGAKDA